jgi:hypothetical protein
VKEASPLQSAIGQAPLFPFLSNSTGKVLLIDIVSLTDTTTTAIKSEIFSHQLRCLSDVALLVVHFRAVGPF